MQLLAISHSFVSFETMSAMSDQNCLCVFKAKPASKTVRVRTRNEEVEGGFTKRRLIIVTRQKDDNNTKDKRLKDGEKYLLKPKRTLTIKGAYRKLTFV